MRPGDRVRVHEPGQPWDGTAGTVTEIDHNRGVQVALDRIPINWRSREAYFVVDQLRLLAKEWT